MGLFSRIRKTFHGDRHNAEIQEELQFHLAMDAAGGHDRREAALRLGNPTFIQEETRAAGIIEWLDSAAQDVRYGLRQLRKTPALAAAVVLSLTIGIGANTAIFSLVDAAILKPLPVRQPDDLRIVEWTATAFPDGVGNVNGNFSRLSTTKVQGSSVSANLYRRLAQQQTAFASLIGIADAGPVAVATDASPAEQVSLQFVSGNFFQGLGVPVMGRSFQEEEDRVGGQPVVIVSHRFWEQHLGGAANVFDRNLRINNVPARIIGVASANFYGMWTGEWSDVYAPLAARVAFGPNQPAAGPRGEDDADWWVRQVGRLRPEISEAAATAQLGRLFRNMVVRAEIQQQKIPDLIALPGRKGFDGLDGKDSSALWILMLLVGVLLLIVCANVANLLLSRSVSRQRESAVRLALGASRARLFRQHLIESGVLAILGAAAGLGLGYVLAQGIHVLFQTGRGSSNAFDLHLDLRVMGYAGILSILTTFLFGLAPALRAARADLGDALKAQTRSVMGGRMLLPRVLVSIQIALCLSALVAAGLLGRSLQNLKWIDLGFDRENLAYAAVNPSQAGYSKERMGLYMDRVRDALARIPGVMRVSPIGVRLLSGNGNISRVSIPGIDFGSQEGIVNEHDAVQRNSGDDDLFATLKLSLLAGRKMERSDHRTGSEGVVVDELFARRYFPNQNPLGLRFGFDPKNNHRFEIVGVVGNSRYNNLNTNTLPTVYETYRPRNTIHFAIRTTMDSALLAAAVRKTIASVDPAVPMTEFHTQTALIDRMLRTERLLGFVSSAFGLVALSLAAIGLAGLLSYAVSRRTNEIGVRMALGAAARDIVRMVLRDWLWMISIGVLIGIPGAYAIGRVLKSVLYKLEPFDPRTATLATVVLIAVALIAVCVPARRAAQIDPMSALREE